MTGWTIRPEIRLPRHPWASLKALDPRPRPGRNGGATYPVGDPCAAREWADRKSA